MTKSEGRGSLFKQKFIFKKIFPQPEYIDYIQTFPPQVIKERKKRKNSNGGC